MDCFNYVCPSYTVHLYVEYSSHLSDAPSPLITVLVPANTDHLAQFPPEPNRGVGEASLVRIDTWPFPFEVDLVRFQPLGLVHELPDEE